MISIDEINKLKAENAKLNAIIDSYQPRLQKYKDILQKIKEIAERCNLCEECSGLDDCERECGDNVEPCSTYQMQIIVNKITKAEEE